MSEQLLARIDPAARRWAATAAAPPRRPADPLALLDGAGARHCFKRGQEIIAAGDPADSVYRVISGSIRSFGQIEDGRRQIAAFLQPGDLLGFEALRVHHLSAEAVTDVVLDRIPRPLLDQLAREHPALGRRLQELALAQLRAAQAQMVLLGRCTAGERVAAFLLEMAERSCTGHDLIELPMTRGDIADHLGMTLETVSRTLSQLNRERIIAVGKSGVRIHDRATLAQFGSELRH